MVDIKKRTKFGFSLAEALVSMLVLSMFFIATSKMITVKPKKEVQTNRHGYFECYVDKQGKLMQKRSDGSYSGEAEETESNTCKFTPPTGIGYVVMYYLYGSTFYVAAESQFNCDNDAGNELDVADIPEEIEITREELSTFDSDNVGFDNGNNKISQLKNFFESSYPTSSIYAILLEDNNNSYAGPALFIGW